MAGIRVLLLQRVGCWRFESDYARKAVMKAMKKTMTIPVRSSEESARLKLSWYERRSEYPECLRSEV